MPEVVGLEKPFKADEVVAQETKVTKLGASPGTNIRHVRKLPATQEFCCGSGNSALNEQARGLTLETRPAFAPKAVVPRWVFVKAAQTGDARFEVELRTDQLTQAITEDESTQQY